MSFLLKTILERRILGEMYFYGDGVDPDQNKALELIGFSADRGFDKAEIFLGAYISAELGVKDFKKGFELLDEAASKGNSGLYAGHHLFEWKPC